VSDCDAIALTLLEGAPSPADRFSEHLRECTGCRRLRLADQSFGSDAPEAVPLGDSLRAALDRDLAPVRYRSAWERAALPVGAIAAVMVSGLTLLGRSPAADPGGAIASGAMLAMALGGVALSLWRGELGLGVPVSWRRLWLAGAAGVFALTLLTRMSPRAGAAAGVSSFAHVGTSAVNAVADPHLQALGPLANLGACASTASVFAGVVALAALWAARRTVPVSAGSMGSVIGASAGLAALAAVGPSCTAGVAHTLAAHGLPAVMATVLCLFLGRRSLSP
jgi:hypothetical protein